jgi:hypothetical protein
MYLIYFKNFINATLWHLYTHSTTIKKNGEKMSSSLPKLGKLVCSHGYAEKLCHGRSYKILSYEIDNFKESWTNDNVG